jgi:MerR family redox-sensitive transcriptional activator SoxR
LKSSVKEQLTITEVSRRSGVAASALRFYEDRGLIESERAGSGHRRYQRSVLRRIAFVVFAQRIGLTLDEIGEELDKLPPDRVPNKDRRSHRRARAPPRRPDRVHRLRLPVAGSLQARQSG